MATTTAVENNGVREIADGVWWVGSNVRTNDLFEGMWQIPHGVALNSYVVKGEKTAIIELVREWAGASTELMKKLHAIGVAPSSIDYIIMNHMEPDHSGFLSTMRELAPKAEIIASARGAALIKAFYGIEGVRVVKTGDTLDLGAGKSFTFVEIPNVHWPDSMVTLETSTHTLFSSDAFGSYGAHKGYLFDDEMPASDREFWEEETLRYYANIVALFSDHVPRAVEKLKGVELKVIAPAHGLLWRGNPGRIVAKFMRFASYKKEAEPEVCVVYGTMYGNTENMAKAIAQGVASEGVKATIVKVPETPMTDVLAHAWRSAGLVLACPTYNYNIFPPMMDFLAHCQHMRYDSKKVVWTGSYGWSEGMKHKTFEEMTAALKWDVVGRHSFNGAPNADDLAKGVEMGKLLAQQVKALPPKQTDAN
eukprot:TRINITY_DN2316_c0_g1_i1.p2 TRINITY_DN2316_c0_g1~~TRINITY_DN2316_c0_g1_i1.p2  ORF type:complete len:440 (-),score=166.99 TRINITY_DN2316_c0_g1_i1:2522-3784(-)